MVTWSEFSRNIIPLSRSSSKKILGAGSVVSLSQRFFLKTTPALQEVEKNRKVGEGVEVTNTMKKIGSDAMMWW